LSLSLLSSSNCERATANSHGGREPDLGCCPRTKSTHEPFWRREFHYRNPGQESSLSESETEQTAGKEFLAMKEIPNGITTETTEVSDNVSHSIWFNCESHLKEIDESDWRLERHGESRVSMLQGMTTDESHPKFPIRIVFDRCRRNESPMQNDALSSSIEIEKSLRFESADRSMTVTLRGTTIDRNKDSENVFNSICFDCEFDSNEIYESNSQEPEHFEPRNAKPEAITIDETYPKYPAIVVFDRLKRKQLSTENAQFPVSIEIEKLFRFENAEPSVNAALRGTTIDCNEDEENASDSIRFNCEFDSNEIDESD
jgi:hypothetical protein